jgi:hypothetical protein
MQRITVDFPEPDSPITPSASPAATSNPTSQAATTAPVGADFDVPASGPVPAIAAGSRRP